MAVGKINLSAWFCKVQIEIKFLGIKFFPCRRRQSQTHFFQGSFQLFPVQIGKDLASVLFLWYLSLIDSHKKENLNVFQPGPFHISHQDLVCGRRDHADLCLGKSRFQDLLKGSRPDLLLPQHFHQLVHKVHNDPVDLAVFFGQGHISCGCKSLLISL